jgi:hypothetical protein
MENSNDCGVCASLRDFVSFCEFFRHSFDKLRTGKTPRHEEAQKGLTTPSTTAQDGEPVEPRGHQSSLRFAEAGRGHRENLIF